MQFVSNVFLKLFQALKRKKRYDRQLQQIDGTLTTIEQQREALEGANTNTAVLQTMNEAAKALKKAHADMNVDQVHDMMDDIAEQQVGPLSTFFKQRKGFNIFYQGQRLISGINLQETFIVYKKRKGSFSSIRNKEKS